MLNKITVIYYYKCGGNIFYNCVFPNDGSRRDLSGEELAKTVRENPLDFEVKINAFGDIVHTDGSPVEFRDSGAFYLGSMLKELCTDFINMPKRDMYQAAEAFVNRSDTVI